VAIGDRVRYVDAGDGSGMIVEVLPRRNRLTRRAAGSKPLEQVIVANVDQVVTIMAAARPAPKWELLDRYLSAAADLGIPALILITKLDLVDAGTLAAEAETYRSIGYPVLLTSAVSGEGIDAFRRALAGHLSVLIGLSGVGKTTLLNIVQPGLGLRVGEVSRATNKGKHTTTNLEMFPLDGGGHLVDTPGMREFGLWDVRGDDLAATFLEMRPYLGRCRFGAGCAHEREPGCAIKNAVAAGHIAERRYQSYLRMR
jgi:ribosome biogenesis GTPase